MPPADTFVASAWCSGVLTFAAGGPSGSSKAPESNIANSVRRTMSSSRAAGTWPEVNMAAVRPPGPPRAGTSRPASVAASGSLTAKMKSGATKPSKPEALRSESSPGLSHVCGPLRRL